MDVLRARASLKGEFRMAQTMIQPVENNPLKFAPNVEEALLLLLRSGNQAFMPADQAIAEKIAARFGLFDEVLASDGQRNLRGPAKAALLTERYGRKGFDYAGNSHVDLQVWPATRCAIVVNGSEELVTQAKAVCIVSHVFPEEPGNPCKAPW